MDLVLSLYKGVWKGNLFFFSFPRLYNSASLVAQMVNNLPAMQETLVQFLGQEDLLEKEMVTHSSILAGDSMNRGAWWATVHGVAKTWILLSD